MLSVLSLVNCGTRDDWEFNELFNSENPFFGGLNNFEKRTYKSEDGSITFTYITNVKGDLNKLDELDLLKQKLFINWFFKKNQFCVNIFVKKPKKCRPAF